MRLAIIDGDVLAYHACKPRWEKKVEYIEDNAIIRLDKNGKRVALEFTKEEDEKYLMECWENFKKDLQRLLDRIYCKDYLMAVKGPNNFRNLLYPEYKLHRHADPTKQNIFVPVLRRLAVAEDLAIESEGCEADDYMRIWAEEAKAAGIDYVICSIDKDLRCIPGKHIKITPNSKKDEGVNIEEVSEIEAMRHYYEQLLKGDPVDNIPGIPGIGGVKASKLLKGCKDEEEMQEIVIEEYLVMYGDKWKDFLLSNGKMIHLQKDPNDYFNLKGWPVPTC